jgi:hypothetical protein
MEGNKPYKVVKWFQPMFKAIDLFTPVAAVAIQAYPNPGSLVLGGIVGVLNLASRFISYQKLTVQMLAKMGKKAEILLEYERDLYKDDNRVQSALVDVYGDILAFCAKAFRFFTAKGELLARIKGVRLTLFKDFEFQLGEEVDSFNNHMDDLEHRASLCDKRRLSELLENQTALHREFRQAAADAKKDFQRLTDIDVKLWKVNQNISERLYRRLSFTLRR